ncbi:hypothetical protein DFS33DRAFT_1289873 [Desarmillaria ectypa]|nr:hypothetical protein DFS33DRAFT_1289873 [Desarmillaria ectypa]
MRYDGSGWFGCITEASPVLYSLASSATVYKTLESIVAKTNLLANPPILENKSLGNISLPDIDDLELMLYGPPEKSVISSAPLTFISSRPHVPPQPHVPRPLRKYSPDAYRSSLIHTSSELCPPHKSSSDGDNDGNKGNICATCVKQYRPYQLRLHSNTHSITPYRCLGCGIELDVKSDMHRDYGSDKNPAVAHSSSSHHNSSTTDPYPQTNSSLTPSSTFFAEDL